MSEPQPLVSIVMPSYNRADYILESIESIRSQTWQHWELIIVDDGSTDNTSELVKGIADSRIQFYKEAHIGMNKVRNLGMLLSKGEYIGLIDSDDLWMPTKLEKQIHALQEHNNDAFCLTGGYNFKEPNVPVDFFYKNKEGIRHGDLFLSFFQSELATLPSTLLFKKEALDIAGEIAETPLADVKFILSLAKNFKGIVVYEALTCRRLHGTNASTLNNLKRQEDGIQMLKSFRGQVSKEILNQSLFRSHLNFGEICLGNSKKKEAFRQFLQAWKYNPLSIVPPKKIAKTILKRS